MKKNLLLLTLLSLMGFSGAKAGTTLPSVDSEPCPIYIIGSNVNGKVWSLGESDARFDYKGNGVYEWHGEVLGTGFKLNDGTWDYEERNWGSNGQNIALNQEYYLVSGGLSDNINIDDYVEYLNNPTVIFNYYEASVKISGEPVYSESREEDWYVVGTFNDWQWEYKMTTQDGIIYEYKGLVLDEGGEFKISSKGLGHQYGGGTPIEWSSMTTRLERVPVDYGNVPYYINGTFDVVWDSRNHDVWFTPVNGDNPSTPCEPEAGTKENPRTVTDMICAAMPDTPVNTWVRAYIVGYVEGTSYNSGCNFSATGCDVKTNLLIAASPYETDPDYCMAIQLPSGDVRNALNLAGHPENIGHEILIYGSNEKYFGRNGLKYVSEYEWIGEAPTPDKPIFTDGPDIYIIGSNVNGEVWELGTNKMENKGNGVYEWTGEVLGTGFKFNDGTWDNHIYDWGVANIGGNGEKLIIGQEYFYIADDGSGNIDFENTAEVLNPHVVLNLYEGSLIVTGDAGKDVEWFITGTFNIWDITDPMIQLNEETYVKYGVNLVLEEGYGELKVATTGWGEQYGSSDVVPAEINSENLSVKLGLVGGEGGACPFYIEGVYDAYWNKLSHILTLVPAWDIPTPPVEIPETVTMAVITNAGASLQAIVKGGETSVISYNSLDEYWSIESLTFNGMDYTEHVSNNTFVTPQLVDPNNMIEVTVAYNGTFEIVNENTGLVQLEQNGTIVKVADGYVYVENVEKGTEVVIYDMNGRIVGRHLTADGINRYKLESGVYIIRIGESAVKLAL